MYKIIATTYNVTERGLLLRNNFTKREDTLKGLFESLDKIGDFAIADINKALSELTPYNVVSNAILEGNFTIPNTKVHCRISRAISNY